MMERIPTFFNWSSGKDSALALHQLLQGDAYSVDLLFTTVHAASKRVSMHGLPAGLLRRQAEAAGLPCEMLELPESPDATAYNRLMRERVEDLKARGYRAGAFGDIFLEDLRAYREARMAELGMGTVFPLWKRDTRQLMEEFIDLGFKAITVCVDGSVLDQSFAGRILDRDFLKDLPPGVDPCGENGEYHTFCFEGPVFRHAVPFHKGGVVYREYTHGAQHSGFWFCDLLPLGE